VDLAHGCSFLDPVPGDIRPATVPGWTTESMERHLPDALDKPPALGLDSSPFPSCHYCQTLPSLGPPPSLRTFSESWDTEPP
jgi:hypothetical protein